MVLFGHGRRITTARGEQLAWWPSDSFTWLLEQVLKSPKVASSIAESQSAIAIPTTVTREARRLIIVMVISQSICLLNSLPLGSLSTIHYPLSTVPLLSTLDACSTMYFCVNHLQCSCPQLLTSTASQQAGSMAAHIGRRDGKVSLR